MIYLLKNKDTDSYTNSVFTRWASLYFGKSQLYSSTLGELSKWSNSYFGLIKAWQEVGWISEDAGLLAACVKQK